MDWHVFAASILGAVLGSIADWVFAGVLFHSRYQRHPEVWRTGGSESLRIGGAQILCLMTSVAFVALASMLGTVNLSGTLRLAVMVWLIAPLPLLVTNALFIKIDPLVTASHAVGWLFKLLLIAVATAILV
jgi:membrane protein YqaA with SNARE-associated domain